MAISIGSIGRSFVDETGTQIDLPSVITGDGGPRVQFDQAVASFGGEFDRMKNEGSLAGNMTRENFIRNRLKGKPASSFSSGGTSSAGAGAPTGGGIFGDALARGGLGGMSVNEFLGQPDLEEARRGQGILEAQFITDNPFEEAFERSRVGIQAGLGRQAQLDQQRLQQTLGRQGAGFSRLRRQQAATQQSTQIANRFLEAEGQLGQLQMAAADRSLNAVNTFVNNFIRIAEAQRNEFSTFMGLYDALANRGSGRQGAFMSLGGSRRSNRQPFQTSGSGVLGIAETPRERAELESRFQRGAFRETVDPRQSPRGGRNFSSPQVSGTGDITSSFFNKSAERTRVF